MSAIHEGATKAGDFNTANRAMELEASGVKTGIPELVTSKDQPSRALKDTLDAAATSKGGLETVNKTGQLMANQAIDTLGVAHTSADLTKATAKSLKTDAETKAAEAIDQATIASHNNLADVKNANEQVLNQTKSSVNDANLEAQKNVDEVNQTFDHMYKTDRTFGATIDQLSQDSGVDVASKFHTNATNEIMPKLVDAARSMKETKNSLYNAIPDAPIDEHSLVAAAKPLMDTGWMPKRVAEAIAGRLGENENMSFKYVFNEVLPKVNKAISEEIRLGANMNPDRLAALKDLRSNIYEVQPQYLIDHGTPEAADAARQAVNYYKNTYITYARDEQTPIGHLFSAIDSKYDEHLATTETVGDTKQITDLGKNYVVADTARQAVKNINDEHPDLAQQTIDFMSEPNYRGGKEDLTKVIQGQVAGAIADHFKKGGTVGNLDSSLIYNTLKDKGYVIKKNLPEWTNTAENMISGLKQSKTSQQSALERLKNVQDAGQILLDKVSSQNKELENFTAQEGKQNVENATKQANQSVKDISDQADKSVVQAERQLKKTTKSLKKSALDKFIETGPDGPLPKQNSYDVFKKLLGTNNNENRIAEIAKRVKAAKDPEAQKGLESAYYNFLRDKLITPSNDKRLSGAQTTKILDDKFSTTKYGQLIFGNYDNPAEKAASLDTMNTMNKLIEFVYKEQAKSSSSSIPLMERIGTQKEAIAGFGYMSRFIFGALNRLGTMVSSTGARVIRRGQPDEVAHEIMSKALTDNDYFIELANDIRDQFLNKKISKADLDGLKRAGVLLTKQEVTNAAKSQVNPDQGNYDKPFKAPDNLK
jgi:hypothetical protein